MANGFTLTFTGDQEVPPNNSPASGTGTVSWDSEARAAAYEFTITGLDFGSVLGMEAQTETTADDVTMMHVHNAPPGANGPVVFGQIGPTQDTDDLSIVLNDDGSWTVSGVWEATDPANVSIEDFAEALDAAAAGSDVPLYFNVHTTTFPGGEIRAQWVAAEAAAAAAGAEDGGDADVEDGLDTEDGDYAEDGGEVDWNALAAQVLANFEATGQWFL